MERAELETQIWESSANHWCGELFLGEREACAVDNATDGNGDALRLTVWVVEKGLSASAPTPRAPLLFLSLFFLLSCIWFSTLRYFSFPPGYLDLEDWGVLTAALCWAPVTHIQGRLSYKFFSFTGGRFRGGVNGQSRGKRNTAVAQCLAPSKCLGFQGEATKNNYDLKLIGVWVLELEFQLNSLGVWPWPNFLCVCVLVSLYMKHEPRQTC